MDGLIRSMMGSGVGLSVGIPGVQNIRLYDGMEATPARAPEDSGEGSGGAGDICLLCTCERNAAAIAASFSMHHQKERESARALAAGPAPIGCVNVIGGPGITHALAGIAEARARRAPILVLATGIKSNLPFSHQIHDVDNLTMLRAVCKTVHRPRSVDLLSSCVAAAARSARKEPRGPAAVLIPSNMLTEVLDPPIAGPLSSPLPRTSLQPSSENIKLIPVADSGPSLTFAQTIFPRTTYEIQAPFFSGPRHGCQDGFGVGTAIGTAIAATRGKNVVVLCTHHDALMRAGLELITAVKRNLRIVVVIVVSPQDTPEEVARPVTPPPSQSWARAVHGTDAGWIKASDAVDLDQIPRLAEAACSSRSVVFASVYGHGEAAVVDAPPPASRHIVPLAKVLVSALSSSGISNIVGIEHAPRSAYSHIINQLKELFQRQSSVATVLTCEDGLAAGFVADGCARSTGRPAALVLSAGSRTPPQAYSGVGESFMDRTPVILILIEEDEENDDSNTNASLSASVAHASVASALCSRMHYPDDFAELYDCIVQAVSEASGSLPSTGNAMRVGSVGVVISKSLLHSHRNYVGRGEKERIKSIGVPTPPSRSPNPRPNKTLVDKCAHDLIRASTVWIHAGLGASSASAALSQLTRSLKASQNTSVVVSTTFSGKGVFDETSPNWLWAGLGRGLPPKLSHFMRETFRHCENSVGLIIGAQLSEVATSHFQVPCASLPQTIWHVDLDENVPGKNVPSAYCVTADAAAFVDALLGAITTASSNSSEDDDQVRDKQDDPVLRKLQAAHKAVRAAENCIVGNENSGQEMSLQYRHQGMNPRAIIECAQNVGSKFHDEDARDGKGSVIFSTDSGNSTIFGVECLRLQHGPRHFLAPTDYSSMGYSIPAAIGAAISTQTLKNNVPTVAFVGDGAFLMTGLSLSTAKKLRLPIVVVVLRDGELGMMSGMQRKMKPNQDIFCTRLPQFSLEHIAGILGVKFFGVDLSEEKSTSLNRSMSAAFVTCVRDCEPVILECIVDYQSADHESWFARGLSNPEASERMARPNDRTSPSQKYELSTAAEDTGWTIFARAVTRWSARTAIRNNGTENALTYGELAHRVRSLASFLTESLTGPRISHGDRVGVWLDNCAEVIIVHYACAKVGAIVVNLNIRLTSSELAYVLSDADPTCLVVSRGPHKTILQEAIRELTETSCPSVRCLIWCRPREVCSDTAEETASPTDRFSPHPFGLLHYSIQDDVYDPYVEAPADTRTDSSVARAGDIWHLYYTSGTTGRPKGVALSHRAMCAHALGTVGEFCYTSADVWGHFAPMYHVADAYAILAITMVGGEHVLQCEYTPLKTLRTIAEAGVTVTNVGSTMLTGMMHAIASFQEGEGKRQEEKRPALAAPVLASLRMLSCGGSPVPADTIRRFRSAAPSDCIYFTSYGMTETCGKISMTLLPPMKRSRDTPDQDQTETILNTSGRPFLSMEVRVVKPGNESKISSRSQEDFVRGEESAFTLYKSVATDGVEVGHVQVRGPTLFDGYWGRPHATQDAFTHDGWFKTGDLAVMKAVVAGETPYLTVVDRRRDLILVGGENVYTSEVENVLYNHVCVREACVYGVPEAVLGQVVKAVVVLDEDHIPEGIEIDVIRAALESHCEAQLAIFKRPVFWEIRYEALPRTGSGKVKRNELRDRDLVDALADAPLRDGAGQEGEKVAAKSFGTAEKDVVACYQPYGVVWRDAPSSEQGGLGPMDRLVCIAGKGVQAEGLASALMTEWQSAVGKHCKRLRYVTSPASLAIGEINDVKGDILRGTRHIVFLPGNDNTKSQTQAAQHFTRKVATIVKHAAALPAEGRWCLWIVISSTSDPSHRCLSALAKVVNAEYGNLNDTTPSGTARRCVSLELIHGRDSSDGSLQPGFDRLANAVLLEMRRPSHETELRLTVLGNDAGLEGRRQVCRLIRRPRVSSSRFQCDPKDLYVVTGAFGGIGFELCRWLVLSCGCQRLVMTVSSSPLSQTRQAALEDLRRSSRASVEFYVVPVDMSHAPEVQAMLRRVVFETPGKLRGVFHLAGAHRDDLLEELDEEKVRAVMGAKTEGAWALLEALQETFDVDGVYEEIKTSKTTQFGSSSSPLPNKKNEVFLCLFSSIFSVLGFKKLGHYAAANGFLDAVRSGNGAVRTISINWGTFEGAGMAHRLGPAWADLWQQGMGMRFVNMRRALSTLGAILATSEKQHNRSYRAAVFGEGIDWREFVVAKSHNRCETSEVAIPPLLSELVESKMFTGESVAVTASSKTATLLKAGSPDNSRLCNSVVVPARIIKNSIARPSTSSAKSMDMKTIVAEVVCSLVPAASLAAENGQEEDLTFANLGLDSLMTPRLRVRLQKRLGIKIPATLFFRCPSMLSLAAALEKLVPRMTVSSPSTPSPLPPNDHSADIVMMNSPERRQVEAEHNSEDNNNAAAMQSAIVEVLREIGITGKIGEEVTFVSLGVDSLTAPRVRALLQKRTGRRIPATTFLRHASVGAVARALGGLVPRAGEGSG